MTQTDTNNLTSLLASEILSCYKRHSVPRLTIEELMLLGRIENAGANSESNQNWVKKLYRENNIRELFWKPRTKK